MIAVILGFPIGIGFILRSIAVMAAIVVAFALIVGFAYLISTLVRLLWNAFEDIWGDAAQWAVSKFSIFKPWRIFSVPFITILCLLCVATMVVYTYMSGQGEVNVIP